MTLSIRARGDIVIIVASSGIAAMLLPSGRTAHSRFAIPINITEYSMCSIGQTSFLAELLRITKLIIWDEAPMIQHYCVEAFDRSLQDIMQSSLPFGGKCLIMGGDFRQILPVIPRGSRASVVNAVLCSSFLWPNCKVFHLTKNMRLKATSMVEQEQLVWFSQWLLDIGDGKLGNPSNGFADIEIPPHLLVPQSDNPIDAIVQCTYPSLLDNLYSSEYFNDRALLAPKIDVVHALNEHVLSLLPGEPTCYLSCDSTCKSTRDIDWSQ